MPVEYEIKVEAEQEDYRGDFSDSRDVQWVTNELNRGNQAAWCWVCVTARFEGFEGVDSLGGCSYRSMKALEKDLIPEMKENALESLRTEIKEVAAQSIRKARIEACKAKGALAKLDKEGA
jgi:hypothetical protein